MEGDQSIPIFLMKMEKNDILCMKTDTRFYGHLELSFSNIYRLEKLNPVYVQYTFNARFKLCDKINLHLHIQKPTVVSQHIRI